VQSRGRGRWGPEMEPQLSLSAVPNGHLAVWDGRDGADVLHLSVPNFSPLPYSLSLFKMFPRRVLWFWPGKRGRDLVFGVVLGRGRVSPPHWMRRRQP